MNFEKFFADIIGTVDSAAGHQQNYLVHDKNSLIDGLYADFDMIPHTAEYLIGSNMTYAYSSRYSRYYHDPKMLEMAYDMYCRTARKLNEDGTWNDLTTNFHTAENFGLVSMVYALKGFRKDLLHTPEENKVHDKMVETVKLLAGSCLKSGFHTPNHRWVESAGLLSAYSELKGDPDVEAYRKKAERYLAEGIDCDEHGEWSERSAGMYNAHCDDSFLMIYEATGKKEYLDAVCRNLDLMMYYINSDYSMFTQNSRRKDKGEVGNTTLYGKGKTYYADRYLEAYIDAGFKTNNNRYLSLAYDILTHSINEGHCSPHASRIFLAHPEYITKEFDYIEDCLPKRFESFLPNSNIVRYRKDEYEISVMANNAYFLHIDAPGINLKARMCASFFAVAQFLPEKLEKTEDGYIMTMTAHGEYKLPLDNPDESCKNYWSIDYSKRKSIQEQNLTLSFVMKFTEDGIKFNVSAGGTDKVPFKLEFFVNPGLHAETGDSLTVTNAGGNIYSKSGELYLESSRGFFMKINGLKCRHQYSANMRGSFETPGDVFTVYSTDFTPVDQSIEIKMGTTSERHVLY